MSFIFITLLTPLLCEGTLCVTSSLLHSGELIKKKKRKRKEVPQPWVAKRKGCFGEAFAQHRGRGNGVWLIRPGAKQRFSAAPRKSWGMRVVFPFVFRSKPENDGVEVAPLRLVRKQKVKRCQVQPAAFPPSRAGEDRAQNPLGRSF